jgi:hypothetical protein
VGGTAGGVGPNSGAGGAGARGEIWVISYQYIPTYLGTVGQPLAIG